MKLNPECYENHPPLKIAFTDGKLAMCEEIKEFAQMIMARYHLNPFQTKTEFEEGQLCALSAIIQSCMAFEESQQYSEPEPQFDA